MCYTKPGPRCSNHARAILQSATQTLLSATEDLNQKTAALSEAKTKEAREELRASQKAHANAVKELDKASKEYDIAKEKRSGALKAYHEAQKDYASSPAGIQENEERAKDPKLSKKERQNASVAAIEGAMERTQRIEAYKAIKNDSAKLAVMKNISHGEQRGMAQSESTNVEQLAEFAYSESEELRHDVASNPNTPEKEILMLTNDVSPFVASVARRHPTYKAAMKKFSNSEKIFQIDKMKDKLAQLEVDKQDAEARLLASRSKRKMPAKR